MNLASFLTASQIIGRKISIQTLTRKLQQLNRVSLFSNLCVINALIGKSMVMGNFLTEYHDLQGRLKENYLCELLRLHARSPRLSHHTVFSRQQTLFLAQLCLLHCLDEADTFADGLTEGGHQLGECILICGDHLLTSRQEAQTASGTDSRRKRHLGFQLAPAFELDMPLDFHLGAVRSETIYTSLLDSPEFNGFLDKKNLKKMDIGVEFKNATGISLQEYIDITVGLISFFLHEADSDTVGHFTLDGFLREATLQRLSFERYLSLEAKDLDDFAHIFRNRSRQLSKQYSFLPFKTHPLLRIPTGQYVCLDLCFLTEKLNAGLYWKIADALGRRRAQTFFEIFGHLFEAYVRKQLSSFCAERGDSDRFQKSKCWLVSSPEYREGGQCFDDVLYFPETKHLLLIESKSSFIRSEIKYGKSIRAFRNDIVKKFVQDDSGEVKGVGQLAAHIRKLFARDKLNRRYVSDQELNTWIQMAERISPILIVQEPVVSFNIIEGYLAGLLKERLKKSLLRSVRISPLTIINIDCLEMLRPHLIEGEITLEQCVNARNHRDPDFKAHFPLFTIENFDLRRKTDPEFDAVFDKVFARASERFFGELT
jgi:hypothetical protein